MKFSRKDKTSNEALLVTKGLQLMASDYRGTMNFSSQCHTTETIFIKIILKSQRKAFTGTLRGLSTTMLAKFVWI